MSEPITASASGRSGSSDREGQSPSVSPTNIPETSKYKRDILARYLKDVTEAHHSNNRDTESTSPTSDLEQEPPYDTLNVGKERVYPPPASVSSSPLLVTSDQIPATNNITINFTNSPQGGSGVDSVPVISPPPRDMGSDKVIITQTGSFIFMTFSIIQVEKLRPDTLSVISLIRLYFTVIY